MEDVPKNRLAEKLRELRRAHGYRQADIAGAIDITQATYSHYETGIRTPGTQIVYRLANFYGMPADDLLKLCIPLDEEVFYDASVPSFAFKETDSFLSYVNTKQPESLSQEERELLYHFSRLTVEDRRDAINYVIFKYLLEQDRLPLARKGKSSHTRTIKSMENLSL